MTNTPCSPILWRLVRGASLATLLLAGGCVLPGEGSRELTIEPAGKYIRYREQFNEAYAAPSSDGGYDLMMASGLSSSSTQYNGRLFPSPAHRITQVIHMHVAWRPMRGVRSDFPAASNTTFHWYIFAGEPAGSEGVLQYSGVGFVNVEPGKTETLFHIQNLTMKPEAGSGKVRDPLGASALSGTIRAQNNASAVQAATDLLQRQLQAVAPAIPAPATEPSGTPPARGYPTP